MSVVANVAINVDSRNAVGKLKQVQQGAQATSQAVDKLNATTAATSDKFKIAANGIKYFTDAAGRTRAENGRFLTTAERAAAGIRNQGNAAQQASGQFNLLKNAFSGLAAAFGAGFALTKVIADVKELDTNLRRLGTVGGNVAALDKGLGALSDRLDGVANKAELAAASYQALSAGFTETGTNLRVVEAATKAAVGGLVDVTSVVEVTTKTLNAYNMSGDQAAKVTDGISKAVELGQVQWSDYTSQLGRVASIAALAGVSLDELNAFVAAATKNGATAEVAFTGLSATLSQILTPAKESQEAAAKLGIQWNLAGLNAKGLSGLMDELAAAMDKDKEAAARMVGPIEAARGAFAAASKDGSDFKNILEQIGGAAGKTDADFQKMKGSLENTLKALDTSFKNLSEALGTAFGPTVVATINQTAGAVNGIATAINEMPQPLKTATAEAVKLIAQFLLLQKAIQITIGLQIALAALTIQSSKLSVATTAGSSAFALYANNAAALAPKVTGVTAVLGNLKLAMLAIPGAGWTAAAIIGLGLLAKAVFDTNETFRNFVKNIGGVVASDFRSAVEGMADDAKDSAANIQKAYEELPPRLSPIAKFIRELFEGAFKDTSNAAETSATASSNAFADFFNGLVSQGAAAFNGLSSLIANWWNGLPGPIRSILGGNAASVLAGAAGAAGSAASRASAPNAQAAGIYGRYGAPSSQVPFAKKTPVANAKKTPVGPAVGDGSSSKKRKGKSDEERAAEEMRQQLKAADDINFALKNRLAIAQTTEPVAKRMLEYDIRQNEIAKEYDELKQAAKSADELILINANLVIEQRIAQIEAEQQINDLLAERALLMADVMRQAAMPTVFNELETQEAALQAVLDKYPAIGAAADAAATLATSGMAAMIDGTKSAQEVFAEFLNTIANALMQTAAKMIAQYIAIGIARMFAGLGGGGDFVSSGPLAAVGDINPLPTSFTPRAVGGPVTGQQPYMVGERGPELFVPGTGGSVVSNGDLRSAMNGGSGGGSGSPVLNMSFQSTSINGVEYVSREQLESAMAETRRNATRDGAKRGMTMTLDRIQNSSSTRRKVGI